MAALICTALLCVYTPPRHSTYMQQMGTCLSLVVESQSVAIDPTLSASLGWHETRLRANLTSSKGAKGPLQVIPRFWCKSEPCDYTRAGLRALRHYLDREPTERHAICRYNAGTCKPKSWAWAGKVMRLADSVREIVSEQQAQSPQHLTQTQLLPRGCCCPTTDAVSELILW